MEKQCLPERHHQLPPSYTASMSLHTPTDDDVVRKRQNKARHAALQPWLGLPSRLFLSLFTPALASILFILIGILTSMSSADRKIDDVKDNLMNACREAERAASAIVSMPYYFATNINDVTAKRIEDIVHGLAVVLLLGITAIETLLVFLVDMYRSLFLCFIELLVRGSLALLTSTVHVFSGAINDIAKSISSSVQGSISGINATLRATLGGLNDILKIVGKSIKIPQIGMPDLSALQNVTLPDGIDGGLRKLNDSLPTLADLKAKMDNLISAPFEELKGEVNSSLLGYSFDRSALPVPLPNNVTYCDNSMDMSPVDDLGNDLRKAAHIGIGILIALVAFVLIVSALMEWYSWRSMQRHVDRARDAYQLAHCQRSDEKDDTMRGVGLTTRYEMLSFLQLSRHPFLAEKALQIANRLGICSEISTDRLRWWLAWLAHPIPLAILAMGLVGLIGVEIQIGAMQVAERHARGRAQGFLDGNANSLQDSINSHLQGLSHDFANKSNTAILTAQDDLNNDMFRWVNTTTSTMNNTLNEFMDGIAIVLNTTFADTPLFTPVQSFIDCIIGQKVAGIEKALTWMQSNSHVQFPLISENVLMLAPGIAQQAIEPAQQAALGDSHAGKNGIVGQLADVYLDGLRRQRTLFIALIIVYFALVSVGTIVALLHGAKSRRAEVPGRLRSPPQWDDQIKEDRTDAHVSSLSQSPAVIAGHRSISYPLLPEVVTLHTQREWARKEDRFKAFVRPHAVTPSTASWQVGEPDSAPYTLNSSRVTCTDAPLAFSSSHRDHHSSIMLGEGYRGVLPVRSEGSSSEWNHGRYREDAHSESLVGSTLFSSDDGRSHCSRQHSSMHDHARRGQSSKLDSCAIVFDGRERYESSSVKFAFDLPGPDGEVDLQRNANAVQFVAGQAL